MNNQAYLRFQLNHAHYGIPAIAVQEIFFLPEVTVVADAPIGILGVLNLRGDLLPVLDLAQTLGQPRLPFQLTDSMIVLEWQTQRFGVIVSQVDDVQMIADIQITTDWHGQSKVTPSEGSLQDDMVMGLATIESTIVTLLNPERFMQSRLEQITLGLESAALQRVQDNSTNGSHDRSSNRTPGQRSRAGGEPDWYDHFDPSARQLLRERTAALQCPIDNEDAAGLMPLAIVGLGGEFFGFELETVHEFTEIRKITPIPCCPPHVMGNINLRGEIITLINIHNVVDLPLNAVRSQPQAVVVRLDQRVAGIAVDTIFDVTYIHPSQVSPPPMTVRTDKDDFLQGIAPYQNHMMSIINLSKLLASEVLVVNEEIASSSNF